MTIYAITDNQSRNSLRDARLFSTRELAQKALKIIADARKYKLGVKINKDHADYFSFLLGHWEETEVSFSIIEIKVEDV